MKSSHLVFGDLDLREHNILGLQGRRKQQIAVVLLSSTSFEMTHKWDSSCITFKHREQRMNLVNNLKTPI